MQSDAFSHYIRKRLHALGLTQGELAERANLSRQTVVKLLSGEVRDPHVATVRSLAIALSVSPVHLFQLLIGRNLIELPVREGALHHGDHSSFVADRTIVNGTIVAPGSRFNKQWEIQNTGRTSWANRSLMCVSLAEAGETTEKRCNFLKPDENQIPIPLTLPGGLVRLSVWMTAPTVPCECVSTWKMVDGAGRLCFPLLNGLTCAVYVVAT